MKMRIKTAILYYLVFIFVGLNSQNSEGQTKKVNSQKEVKINLKDEKVKIKKDNKEIKNKNKNKDNTNVKSKNKVVIKSNKLSEGELRNKKVNGGILNQFLLLISLHGRMLKKVILIFIRGMSFLENFFFELPYFDLL